jgi:hypothetical protein
MKTVKRKTGERTADGMQGKAARKSGASRAWRRRHAQAPMADPGEAAIADRLQRAETGDQHAVRVRSPARRNDAAPEERSGGDMGVDSRPALPSTLQATEGVFYRSSSSSSRSRKQADGGGKHAGPGAAPTSSSLRGGRAKASADARPAVVRRGGASGTPSARRT